MHCIPAASGKGVAATVLLLYDVRSKLQSELRFAVLGLAFDSGHYYNSLHIDFERDWRERIIRNTSFRPIGPGNGNHTIIARSLAEFVFVISRNPLIILDPLHLLKRVRYRRVTAITFCLASCAVKNGFNLDNVQRANIVSLLVFVNSPVSKMHDSFPLRLFSPRVLARILTHRMERELLMVSWCLLMSVLTIPGLSTASRADLLEIGFWVLYYCEKLTANNQFHKISERNATGCDLSLYTTAQHREALNTFASLITLLQTCLRPICLDRIGSNPLDHTFGKARLRC
jgi:hypothetical protein